MPPRTRPDIIPIFIPHQGCPHQCVFCNQLAIAGIGAANDISVEEIRRQVDTFLAYPRHNRTTTQIAFFGGNFLGLPKPHLTALLSIAQGYVRQGVVDSVRFSTRPDTVSGASLSIVEPFPVKTIELGVQSMDDHILKASGRGHTASEAEMAIAFVKNAGYEVGVQMMVGLPGDNGEATLATAEKLTTLGPAFVRIYPTLVVAGSALAVLYREGAYRPLSLDASVDIVKQVYRLFEAAGIPVIRMGVQPTDGLLADLLAGPFHPSFGHLVLSAIFLDKVVAAVGQGDVAGKQLDLRVHPRAISKMRGMRNENMAVLQRRFGPAAISVRGDAALADNEVRVSVQAV